MRYDHAYDPPMARLRYEADGTERLVDWPARLAWVKPGLCIPNGVHREGARWRGRITELRVERLHDITEEEARREGVPLHHAGLVERVPVYGWPELKLVGATARDAYAALYDYLYGPGAWKANPWVWVVRWEGLPNS